MRNEPATPLPWHWDSDPIKNDPLGRDRYRLVAIGRTITQMYYSSGDPDVKQDTMYAVHACNAYPKLVAALKAVAKWVCDDDRVPDSEMFDHDHELTEGDVRKCRNLLRELGELE